MTVAYCILLTYLFNSFSLFLTHNQSFLYIYIYILEQHDHHPSLATINNNIPKNQQNNNNTLIPTITYDPTFVTNSQEKSQNRYQILIKNIQNAKSDLNNNNQQQQHNQQNSSFSISNSFLELSSYYKRMGNYDNAILFLGRANEISSSVQKNEILGLDIIKYCIVNQNVKMAVELLGRATGGSGNNGSGSGSGSGSGGTSSNSSSSSNLNSNTTTTTSNNNNDNYLLNAKLKLSAGITALLKQDLPTALRHYLSISNKLTNQFNDVISAEDIATHGALLAMACIRDRNKLGALLLDGYGSTGSSSGGGEDGSSGGNNNGGGKGGTTTTNSSSSSSTNNNTTGSSSTSFFKSRMDLIPPLRNAVQHIVRAEYGKCLSILSSLRWEFNLDPYLNSNSNDITSSSSSSSSSTTTSTSTSTTSKPSIIDHILNEIRDRCIERYLKPYTIASISKMAIQFQISSIEEMENAIANLIWNGQLSYTKIDSVNGIVRTYSSREIVKERLHTRITKSMELGDCLKEDVNCMIMRLSYLESTVDLMNGGGGGGGSTTNTADAKVGGCHSNNPREKRWNTIIKDQYNNNYGGGGENNDNDNDDDAKYNDSDSCTNSSSSNHNHNNIHGNNDGSYNDHGMVHELVDNENDDKSNVDDDMIMDIVE